MFPWKEEDETETTIAECKLTWRSVCLDWTPRICTRGYQTDSVCRVVLVQHLRTSFLDDDRQCMHYSKSSVTSKTTEVKYTNREPRVGLVFSSFSTVGLRSSRSTSLRGFFLLSLPLTVDTEEEGRFPFMLEDDGYICSVGGVPIVSDPCDEGDE